MHSYNCSGLALLSTFLKCCYFENLETFPGKHNDFFGTINDFLLEILQKLSAIDLLFWILQDNWALLHRAVSSL